MAFTNGPFLAKVEPLLVLNRNRASYPLVEKLFLTVVGLRLAKEAGKPMSSCKSPHEDFQSCINPALDILWGGTRSQS